LLTSERLLCRRSGLPRGELGQDTGALYVVVRGEGGEGKTTLAVELACWLVPFLYEQQFEDPHLASCLTLLDLPTPPTCWMQPSPPLPPYSLSLPAPTTLLWLITRTFITWTPPNCASCWSSLAPPDPALPRCLPARLADLLGALSLEITVFLLTSMRQVAEYFQAGHSKKIDRAKQHGQPLLSTTGAINNYAANTLANAPRRL
jgi:hypothetical protein